MAALVPTTFNIFEDRTGNHFVVAEINHDGGSNTVDLPGGLVSAACLPATTSDTAPTVTVTQGNDPGTSVDGGTQSQVTVSGGSSGRVYLVSRHVGSAAGL